MNYYKYSAWKLNFVMIVMSFLMSLSLAKEYPILNIEKNDLKRTASLITSSKKFQVVAANNYANALLALSKGWGMEKLHTIDKTIWDVKISQVGWKLFFDSAILIYNQELDKYPLVAYYNPFSDMYLITLWALNGKEYNIVDAEMLMGDFVRGSNNELNNTPFWLREKKHRTVNLGISTALSALSFEEIFEKATVENWRQKLKILNHPTALREFNYPNVSITINGHLLNVMNFLSEKNDDYILQECHRKTIEINYALQNKTTKDEILILADETPLGTVKVLRNIPPKWIEELVISVVQNNGDKCLVLLTPRYQKNVSISYLFKDDPVKKQLQLKRIDLIDYQRFYNEIKFYQEKKQKGVL